MISVFGAEQGVNYLRLVGNGSFASSAPPRPSSGMVDIHQEIFPQIVEQVQMMELLRDNETVMDFMIRITVRAQLFLGWQTRNMMLAVCHSLV